MENKVLLGLNEETYKRFSYKYDKVKNCCNRILQDENKELGWTMDFVPSSSNSVGNSEENAVFHSVTAA